MLPPNTQNELKACDINSAELDRLLALSYDNFDQNFTGGWRAVSKKPACENAAGEIIKSYILYSNPKAPKSMKILRWHAGQMKASAGKIHEALALFRGAYNVNDDDDHVEWDLYVDATIAFLDGNKVALEKARDTLADIPVPEELKNSRRKFIKDNPNITMPDGFVDEPQNLTAVNNLWDCFGQPYSKAYGKCNTEH